MPDTGAPWNIPYVAGTDLVADWPTDSQTLANAIADGLTDASIVKQVVSTTLTSVYSVSLAQGTFDSNVTGLEATITPSSASNKVLVSVSINGENDRLELAMLAFRLMRDSTPIGIGDAAAGRAEVTTQALAASNTAEQVVTLTASFLDAPATTSAVTYGIQLYNQDSSIRTLYLNRTRNDTTAPFRARGICTITVMEVAP